jgi:hypothetical protein
MVQRRRRRGRTSPGRGLILFDPNEPCGSEMKANANSEMSEASGSRGTERENETINECLLETGNPSGTIENESFFLLGSEIIKADANSEMSEASGSRGTETERENELNECLLFFETPFLH